MRSVLACGFYPLAGRLLPVRGNQGGPRSKATVITAKDEKVSALPLPCPATPNIIHAVLCCAVLRCAVLCCAVLCCAVLCYAMLSHAILCYAVASLSMLSDILHCAVPFCATPTALSGKGAKLDAAAALCMPSAHSDRNQTVHTMHCKLHHISAALCWQVWRLLTPFLFQCCQKWLAL